MRLTEFHELVDDQFGPVRGRSLLVDHVLTGFGGRTAAQAIEDGVDPRDVGYVEAHGTGTARCLPPAASPEVRPS